MPNGDLDNSLSVPPADGNLSFVLNKVDDITFEQKPVQKPLPDQVQVNVRQTGICGSDVSYWVKGYIGDFVVKKPMVLGHESSGIVTAVGSNVKAHKVGDRVALEPGEPCLMCNLCRSGLYYHCKDLAFAATPPYDGTLATYYNLHAGFAHKVPDNMSLEEASLMEPLAVAVQSAVVQGKVEAMSNVLIFGAGPIGLLCGAVCRAMGAKSITVVDIVEEKLTFAKDYCQASTFLPSPAQEGEDKMAASERNAKALLAVAGEDVNQKGGFDLVLECTGAPPCIQMGVHAARMRSRMVLVGMGPRDVLVPVWRINIKEIELVGTFRYGASCYPLAIELTSSKRVDVSRLVTHRYAFSDSLKAFQTVKSGKGEDGKAAIKVQISQGKAQ